MRRYKYIKEHALNAVAGNDIQLSVNEGYDRYVITGGAGATMANDITIRAAAGEALLAGDSHVIKYEGDVVPDVGGGFLFDVFGRVLTAEQCKQQLLIHVVYDGAAWEVDIIPLDVTTGNIEVLTTRVSFETGEQGDNPIVVPFAFEIIKVRTVVKKALANTDAGTVTLDIGGTPVVGGVVTIALSSAVDEIDVATPTDDNTGAADATINCVGAKVTAGGIVDCFVYVKKV